MGTRSGSGFDLGFGFVAGRVAGHRNVGRILLSFLCTSTVLSVHSSDSSLICLQTVWFVCLSDDANQTSSDGSLICLQKKAVGLMWWSNTHPIFCFFHQNSRCKSGFMSTFYSAVSSSWFIISSSWFSISSSWFSISSSWFSISSSWFSRQLVICLLSSDERNKKSDVCSIIISARQLFSAGKSDFHQS